MIEPCPRCGARVVLRADGSCPACGPLADRTPAPLPREIGQATVTLFTPLHRSPRDLQIRMPTHCACCGTAEGTTVLEVPAEPSEFVPLSSCTECIAHLAPPRRRWAAPLAVGVPLVVLAGARALGDEASQWAGLVVAVAAFGTGLVLDRRGRTPSPRWPEPRDRHCGPVFAMRVGGNLVFTTQHLSWLRALQRGNEGAYETKLQERRDG